MKYKNNIIFLVLGLVLILISPMIVLAASNDAIQNLEVAAGLAGFNQETSPTIIAVRWINGFLSIFGIVSTYFLVTAGFMWMTSGGNAEKVLAAKNTIKSTLLGVLVALTSYALVRYVITVLAVTTGASN